MIQHDSNNNTDNKQLLTPKYVLIYIVMFAKTRYKVAVTHTHIMIN